MIIISLFLLDNYSGFLRGHYFKCLRFAATNKHNLLAKFKSVVWAIKNATMV